MRLFRFAVAVWAMLAFLPPSVDARTVSNQPIGKIIGFRGKTYIVRDNERITATPGMLLRISDKIESEEREAMEIAFFGVGRVRIGRNSAVQIKTLTPSETGLRTRVTLSLLFGTALFSVGDNEVEVQTPTANVRARNKAEFYVRHEGDKTQVFSVADSVTLASRDMGPDAITVLPAGRSAAVVPGQRPTAGAPFSENDIAGLEQTTSTAAGDMAAAPATGAEAPLGYTPPEAGAPMLTIGGGGAAVTPAIGGGGGGANPSQSKP